MAHGIKANAVPIIRRESQPSMSASPIVNGLGHVFRSTSPQLRTTYDAKSGGVRHPRPPNNTQQSTNGVGFRQGMVIYGGEAVA